VKISQRSRAANSVKWQWHQQRNNGGAEKPQPSMTTRRKNKQNNGETKTIEKRPSEKSQAAKMAAWRKSAA